MASPKECGFTFTWIIENIENLALNGTLISPNFNVNCLHKTEWSLRCDLRTDEKFEKIEKWLELYKVATEPYYISVNYELSLFDSNNKKLQTFTARGMVFHRGSSMAKYKCCNLKEFSRVKTIRCRMWLPNTNFCDTEQGFGRTRICIERRHFMWTNTNVSQMEKKTIFMTIDSKKCLSKSICLLLNTSRICERKLQVELSNNFTCNSIYSCGIGLCISYPYIKECQISIVDFKGSVITFPDQEKWKIEEEMNSPSLYLKSKIPKGKCHDKYYFQFPLNSANKELTGTCMQNGSVSFHCECDICFGVELNQLEDASSVPLECNDNNRKRQDGCETATSPGTPLSYFMKDMQQLCTEKKFCDFSLKTETDIFPVHRAILGVRSPVFKAMFSHDMKENENKCVDVPDLSADTVRRMLSYIYTDKVENILWEDAFDLYIAGDKYQMLNLKERCSSIMKSNLFLSNVCQILVLAQERHDEDLKRAAEDYIVDHDAEIIRLDAWKDIERNNPKLGVDILRQIVFKRQKV